MKKIKPFKSVYEAMKSLDNGGRFYNIFTKAADNVISGAELSKVAGFGQSYQKSMLFLQMSISELNDFDQQKIISRLSDKLKETYQKYLAQEYTPSEVESNAKVSTSIILTGVPKLKESKSEFSGFIYVPIQAGNVTTFVMVPIMEEYDVYDLEDEKTGDSFVIAHIKNKENLPERPIKVGGILKELKEEEKEESSTKVYLEAAYHL